MPFSKGHKLNMGNQYARGRKHTDEWKQQARMRMMGNNQGFRIGEQSPRKGIKSTSTVWNKGLKLPQYSGKNHPNWIKDRTKIKLQDRKNNPRYKEWRRSVWERDSFRCKISNEDCSGRIEAHHILRWSEHPELRYKINNGITLCKFHHPLKKKEEIQLSNKFLTLIGVNIPQFNNQ